MAYVWTLPWWLKIWSVEKQRDIHTHDIPFVHGSGAIGLKNIQSNTNGLGSLDSKPCTVIDTDW